MHNYQMDIKKDNSRAFDLRAIYFADIPKKQTREIENNRNYSTFLNDKF